MTGLWCKLAGAGLLALAGFGAGLAYSCRAQGRWQALCTWERFLLCLSEEVRRGALPADELLAQLALSPAFAAYCPDQGGGFAALRPPDALGDACTAETRAGLETLACCGRAQACQTLAGLCGLCRRCQQIQYARMRQAAALGPKLGLCAGLLAAVLLWPA